MLSEPRDFFQRKSFQQWKVSNSSDRGYMVNSNDLREEMMQSGVCIEHYLLATNKSNNFIGMQCKTKILNSRLNVDKEDRSIKTEPGWFEFRELH